MPIKHSTLLTLASLAVSLAVCHAVTKSALRELLIRKAE